MNGPGFRFGSVAVSLLSGLQQHGIRFSLLACKVEALARIDTEMPLAFNFDNLGQYLKLAKADVPKANNDQVMHFSAFCRQIPKESCGATMQ